VYYWIEALRQTSSWTPWSSEDDVTLCEVSWSYWLASRIQKSLGFLFVHILLCYSMKSEVLWHAEVFGERLLRIDSDVIRCFRLEGLQRQEERGERQRFEKYNERLERRHAILPSVYIYAWTCHSLYSVLQQAHSFFQSEFSTECDLVLPFSISSIFSFS
jgi:hypothetical protein